MELTKEQYEAILELEAYDEDILACTKGYTLKKILGSGTFGKVFDTCKPKNNCVYAMKITDKMYNFEQEVTYTKMASNMGVGPKFYGAWICRNKGFIVTEKYTMTLFDYLRKGNKLPLSKFKQLRTYLQKIHNIDLIHGDLKFENVMLKLKNSHIEKIGIIDWGLAFRKSKQPPIEPKKLQKYFIGIFGKSFPYALRELNEDPTLWDEGLMNYFVDKDLVDIE